MPAIVKLALPATFIDKIDGVSVSRFVHQLDCYFEIVGLTDDINMGQISIPLLESAAYNWFEV